MYNGREFLRCGYYVSVNYESPEMMEDPPETVKVDRLQRTIISDKPRIFKIPIDWGVQGFGYEFPTEEEEAKYGEEDYNTEIRKHLIKELTTQELDENSHVLSNFDAPVSHLAKHDMKWIWLKIILRATVLFFFLFSCAFPSSASSSFLLISTVILDYLVFQLKRTPFT